MYRRPKVVPYAGSACCLTPQRGCQWGRARGDQVSARNREGGTEATKGMSGPQGVARAMTACGRVGVQCIGEGCNIARAVVVLGEVLGWVVLQPFGVWV